MVRDCGFKSKLWELRCLGVGELGGIVDPGLNCDSEVG